VTESSGRHTGVTTWWRRLPIVLVPCLVAATALSACGGGASASPPSSRIEVGSATIPGLGHVLIDGAGYTLYAYMPDQQGPSRCLGHCAKEWPPLVLPTAQQHAVAGPGVRASLLGTVRRRDGDRQVTYDGWPLYTTADTTPGQAYGQASTMGGWYAISVSGAVDHGTVASS
jgi:predicted lipoprotein with Yx(FWY)xxD motif